MNKTWKEEELQFLIDNFANLSKKEIAEELNRTPNAVQLKANRLGLKKPEKYFYDKRFFQYINSEEKAYWLGFFFADGYTQYNPKQRNYEASVMLSSKDLGHLKKLNKSVNGNIEIKTQIRGCGFDNGKQYEVSSIRFYSTEFIKDLIRWGCTPNKVKQMVFPKIDESFIWPFIRGYFDGDGCITLDKKRNTPRCDFASTSYEFLDDIREILYKNDICSYYTKEKSGVKRLYIGGMENCNLFLKKMYSNATIYLDRKYFRYVKYLKDCNIKNRIENNNGHHRKTKYI